MDTDKEDVLCTLIAARTLIDCEGWCQGENAIGVDGNRTWVRGLDAVAFCAQGALLAVCPLGLGARFTVAYFVLEAAVADRLTAFNDAPGRTKAQVLKAFDVTIARLEREMES